MQTGALSDALQAALENESQRCAERLADIAPRLARMGQSERALDVARKIEDPYFRVEALVGVTSYLNQPEQRSEVLSEALEAARRISDRRNRDQRLAQIAQRLATDGHTVRSLDIAREIGEGSIRAHVLAEIATYLTESQSQKDILIEALESAREIKYGHYVRLVPVKLALLLAQKGHTAQALQVAWEIGNSTARAQAFIDIAEYLAESQLQEALRPAREIKDSKPRGSALAEIASQLALKGDAEQATQIALDIDNDFYRAQAMAEVAPYIPEPKRTELLSEALEVAQRVADPWESAIARASIAPHLAEPKDRTVVLSEVMQAVQDMTDGQQVALATHLARKGQAEQALQVARGIRGAWGWDIRAQALVDMAPYLTEAHLQEAVRLAPIRADACVMIGLGDTRNALAEMATYLNDLEQHAQALSDAWSAVREMGPGYNGNNRANALVGIARYLTEPQLQEALRLAQSIEDENWPPSCDTAVAGIVPYLAKHWQTEQALQAARGITEHRLRAEAIASIVPYIAEPKRTEVFNEALHAAQELDAVHFRSEALAIIAAHMPCDASDSSYRLWKELLHLSTPYSREEVLRILSSLMPGIYEMGGVEAVVELSHAIRDVGNWWP